MSERDELIECLRVCGACHGCGIGADGDTCTNCGDERQLNRLAASLLERDGAELERLRAEVERLTAERDGPRYRCPQCDQLRLELGEARAKIANLVRWQEEAVRNCAQKRCGRKDARIVELEADLLAQINTNIEVGGLLDAALARAEAAEKDAARWKHVRSVPAVPNPLMIVDFQTNTAYVGDKADEMVDAGIAEWTRAAQQAGAS